MLHQPNADEAKVSAVSRKIDEQLRRETRGFFARCVQRNAKKWASLKESILQESQTLYEEAKRRLDDNEPTQSLCNALDKSSLDAEAQRLEYIYHHEWHKYEAFHLEEAFKSQQSRIDSDWAGHEKKLREEYDGRRQRIAPQQGGGAERAGAQLLVKQPLDHDSPSRWQHPEKQKTLIHTAPVLSPSAGAKMNHTTSSGMRRSHPRDGTAAALEVIDSWGLSIIALLLIARLPS